MNNINIHPIKILFFLLTAIFILNSSRIIEGFHLHFFIIYIIIIWNVYS